MRVLVLDNYDSFTWNLVQPLAAGGADCVVRRSDSITCAEIAGENFDRILISPGPFGPGRTGVCAQVVRELGASTPILGVCLGMQVIAASAGARVIESGAPVHGKQRLVNHTGRGVLRGLPDPLTVGLYHSLIVEPDSVSADLEITAASPDGVVMACRLVGKPVEGVLFHPESFLTPDGGQLLDNFMTGRDGAAATVSAPGQHGGPPRVE
jgi:anthranilate synthase/aminodeoxychorismate synthase-like glutamine amidotransferase